MTKFILSNMIFVLVIGCGDAEKKNDATGSTEDQLSILDGDINSDGFLILNVTGLKYPKTCTEMQDSSNSVKFAYSSSSDQITTIVRTKLVAGTQSVKTYELSYDERGNFTGYTSDVDLASGPDKVTITYDSEGSINSYYDPITQVTNTYTFDDSGDLTRIENSNGSNLYDWNSNTESRLDSSGSKSFERKYYTMIQSQTGIAFGPVKVGNIPEIIKFGQQESTLSGEQVFSCSKIESVVECEAGDKNSEDYIYDKRQLFELVINSGPKVRKANKIDWISSSTSSTILYNSQGRPVKQEYQDTGSVNTWEYDNSGINLISSSVATTQTVCTY